MRRADWQARLTDYVISVQGASFRPGRLDCALFAAGAVRAMTGRDHARGFRGYRTLAGGARRLQARGFEDHVALVAARLEEVPPAFAQAGDLAVIPTGEGPALGIVQGEQVYVMRPDGLGLVSRLDAARAFRVS
jgi:hypothetical protein